MTYPAGMDDPGGPDDVGGWDRDTFWTVAIYGFMTMLAVFGAIQLLTEEVMEGATSIGIAFTLWLLLQADWDAHGARAEDLDS